MDGDEDREDLGIGMGELERYYGVETTPDSERLMYW